MFSIDLYGPKQKIAVPRLCNEIVLTASDFAPQPELPSLDVEVLEVAPIFDYIQLQNQLWEKQNDFKWVEKMKTCNSLKKKYTKSS